MPCSSELCCLQTPWSVLLHNSSSFLVTCPALVLLLFCVVFAACSACCCCLHAMSICCFLLSAAVQPWAAPLLMLLLLLLLQLCVVLLSLQLSSLQCVSPFSLPRRCPLLSVLSIIPHYTSLQTRRSSSCQSTQVGAATEAMQPVACPWLLQRHATQKWPRRDLYTGSSPARHQTSATYMLLQCNCVYNNDNGNPPLSSS